MVPGMKLNSMTWLTLIIIQKFIFHCLNLKVCFWTVHFEMELGRWGQAGVVTEAWLMSVASTCPTDPISSEVIFSLSCPRLHFRKFTLPPSGAGGACIGGSNIKPRIAAGGRRRGSSGSGASTTSDHTNLSKPPLGLGDVGFLIHHPSSPFLNPCFSTK